MKLAIIPARGGSKRIKRKNIADFFGKPMLAWALDVALSSGCFDAVVVSTDDEEIAGVAMGLGASVPFMRPAELSDDFSGTTSVVAHAVNWHQQNGINPEYVCCIYATAPFLEAEDLKTGMELVATSDCDYAFSVTRYPFPIQRAIRLTGTNRVEMLNPEHFESRSQDLEEVFHDAGQFYWGRSQAWLAEKPIFSHRSIPVVLPTFRVQDIDTPEDWVRAERLFELQRRNR